MVVVAVMGVVVVAVVLGAGLVRADEVRRVGIDVEVGDEAETTFVRTGPSSPFRMPMRDVDPDRPAVVHPRPPGPSAAPASPSWGPRSSGAPRPARRPVRQPARSPARPRPSRPAPAPVEPARPSPLPAPPAPPAPAPEVVRPAPPGNPGPVGGGADPSRPTGPPAVASPNAGGGAGGPDKGALAAAVGTARTLLS